MGIEPSDKSVFDAVYEEHAETIYRVALHYSNDHHAAEDITQKVFMDLYIKREEIAPDHYVAWLKKAARNIALNYKRDAKWENILPKEALTIIVDKIVFLDSYEKYYIREKDRIKTIVLAEKVCNELYLYNPQWYEVIMATYVDGKTQKEVAELLGLSYAGVRIMLHRARKWIKKRYQKEWDHLDKA